MNFSQKNPDKLKNIDELKLKYPDKYSYESHFDSTVSIIYNKEN